jgi:hypothetical protein
VAAFLKERGEKSGQRGKKAGQKNEGAPAGAPYDGKVRSSQINVTFPLQLLETREFPGLLSPLDIMV